MMACNPCCSRTRWLHCIAVAAVAGLVTSLRGVSYTAAALVTAAIVAVALQHCEAALRSCLAVRDVLKAGPLRSATWPASCICIRWPLVAWLLLLEVGRRARETPAPATVAPPATAFEASPTTPCQWANSPFPCSNVCVCHVHCPWQLVRSVHISAYGSAGRG